MALTITPDAFTRSYSSFHQWRIVLAQAAGVKWPDSWTGMAAEPALRVLLCHNDDGGEISAEDAGPLADRLEQLAPLLSEEWQHTTNLFIVGARRAVASDDAMRFI